MTASTVDPRGISASGPRVSSTAAKPTAAPAAAPIPTPLPVRVARPPMPAPAAVVFAIVPMSCPFSESPMILPSLSVVSFPPVPTPPGTAFRFTIYAFGKIIVVNLIINSPRPFTRPGRFDSVTSPLTYDPAGITTFPSIITGNKVSKYTGSPGRALRVDTALCSTSGICVPAGTMIFAAAVALGATADALGAAGATGVEVAPFAAGPDAAEPPAVVPEPEAGAAGADVPEPADASGSFCAAVWLAAAGAEVAGGGDIGPASCAAKGSAHPAVTNNRRACGKRNGLFVIGPLFTMIR